MRLLRIDGVIVEFLPNVISTRKYIETHPLHPCTNMCDVRCALKYLYIFPTTFLPLQFIASVIVI